MKEFLYTYAELLQQNHELIGQVGWIFQDVILHNSDFIYFYIILKLSHILYTVSKYIMLIILIFFRYTWILRDSALKWQLTNC